MRRVLKHLGFGVYLLLVCFLLLEVILRLSLYEEEANGNYWGIGAFQEATEVGYIHKPNFKGQAVRRPNFICNVEINEFGLRQKEIEKQLAYDDRILFLGDSFTVGLGVEEEEMFTSRITGTLNEFGIGVINAGQSGYCITQEYRLAQKLLAQNYYDHIFLCLYLSNDIRGDFYRGFEKTEVAYGYRLLKNRAFKNTIVDYIRTHSYSFMYVSTVLRKKWRKGRKVEAEGFTHNSKLAIANIKRLCKEQDIDLTIMLIPDFKMEVLHEEEFNRLFAENDIDYFKANIPREGYFHIDGHWNSKGHLLASEAIIKHMESSGLFKTD